MLAAKPKIAVSEAALQNERATQLMRLGRYDEALPILTTVVRVDPTLGIAHSNLATCYFALRKLPEARAAYRAATAADPQFIYPRVQALTLARELCEWQEWEREVEELCALAPSPGNTAPQLDLLFLPLQPEALRAHAECHASPPWVSLSAPRKEASRRTAIGYVSDEIRNHVVGTMLVEVLELHDRSGFDVHLFDWGKPANSIVERRVRRAGVQVHDLSRLDNRHAAAFIASLGIDVLVDLKGYTTGHRNEIFRYRPAPVQVSWLGYPGTLGTRYIDYLVADPFVIPRGEEHDYTERVVRLPSVFLPADRQKPVADSGNRAVFGLREDAVVLCYLGRSAKLAPDVFDDWLAILAAVPGSVLWMRADNEIARANLLKQAAQRGLAPGRIIFFREAAHLRGSDLIARYRFADLALDTYPYGSHATASESLWAGCPLLTRVGPTYASRVAGSLLNALGLGSLITNTREEFRSRAIELASDPGRLTLLREQLAQGRANSDVFDTPRFTRALERGYQAAIRRYDEGQLPADIDVAAD